MSLIAAVKLIVAVKVIGASITMRSIVAVKAIAAVNVVLAILTMGPIVAVEMIVAEKMIVAILYVFDRRCGGARCCRGDRPYDHYVFCRRSGGDPRSGSYRRYVYL